MIAKLQRPGMHVDPRVLATELGFSEALGDEILSALISEGWLEPNDSRGVVLTDKGQARAHELVRIHRLWEQYLVEHEGMSPDDVHTEAHRREHTTTAAEAEILDDELGYPARDPHGHVIPDAGSPVPDAGGMPLTQCSPGEPMRVLHVADEPPALFAQLAAMGLIPGAIVELAGKDGEQLHVRVNERVFPLAGPAARRVYVSAAPAHPVAMGELAPGSRARVVETGGTGKHQRRMLDMGLVPGAEVEVVRMAPLGDPVEYRVKGTAISMRRDDANTVLVEQESGRDDG